jgi:hypothetical protein
MDCDTMQSCSKILPSSSELKCHNPEDLNLNNHCHEQFKTKIKKYIEQMDIRDTDIKTDKLRKHIK